jgi:hypothetical protein
MKTKIAFVLLGVLTVAALGIAYNERSRSAYIRNDFIKLHKQLKESEKKFEAVRIEASKLRYIIENERKKFEQAEAHAEAMKK